MAGYGSRSGGLRALAIRAERGDCGAHDQRHDKQEANAEDHPERQYSLGDEPPQAGGPRHGGAPDAVQRVLQFSEDRGRPDKEYDDSDRGRYDAARRRTSALPQSLAG